VAYSWASTVRNLFVALPFALLLQDRGELTREKKLELDVKYVETAGFLTDIKIILATIAQVFSRKNIYEKKYSQTEYTRGENK